VTPSGRNITPANAATLGGQFVLTNGTASEISSSIFPSMTGNSHYIYSIPTEESGNYTVRFQAPSGLTEEVPILTEISWDSPVVAKLFATEPIVAAGRSAVLGAVVFNGNQPVAGATVQVVVKDQAGNKTQLTLLDNGSQADQTAGDGLYSGEFTPQVPGQYSIIAGISGTIGTNTFKRDSATRIEVVPASSKLNGTVTEQPSDDNFDGLIDRVAFSVGTQTTVAGDYQAFVHLKTASGKAIVGSGIAQLANGSGLITVNVYAEEFREAGENGPYLIESIELDALNSVQGSRTIDRLRDLGQTRAYTIRQFQRKPLILTGVISEQGFDDNGNNKFDRFQVSVQVDVLNAGYYQWNWKLSDQNSQKIDFASGSGFLSAGLNQLRVTFNGLTIGRSGKSGPFLIDDFLMFGPKSLVAAEVGRTALYRSSQFEGGRESEDSTPPNLQVVLSPDTLWSPNHQMQTITATITVTDDTDANPTVKLLSIESNEPDTGAGNGDQPNDIQGANFGTDDRQFLLRAERFGTGIGRIYTVKYEARDAAGNATVVTRQVLVPHDRRN
jgi:hypothetical protein